MSEIFLEKVEYMTSDDLRIVVRGFEAGQEGANWGDLEMVKDQT